MIEVGQIYTHRKHSGRYTVTGLPLSSGILREQGLEVVDYQCLMTTRKFARLKHEFEEKMILITNNENTNKE